MRWILCLLMFVSLGFAPAPVYRPKPSLKYRDLLQGKWSLISSQSNNGPATKPDERVLVVRGSVCEIQEGSPTQSRYRIARDETKNEGPLELHEEGNTDPNDKPYRGFYRVVGDELTLGTWLLAGDGNLTMERRFQLLRNRDQLTVLRGRWKLVCIELSTGKPRRMPAEFCQIYLSGIVGEVSRGS